MSNITENLNQIKNSLPPNVTLVAISKTKPNEDILEVYNTGHKIFGENKVQELVEKYEILPKDIEWHLVGHLQSNKIKYIAEFVSLIHSVDSMKLLLEINKHGIKIERKIPVLLQIYIAKEETKFGLGEGELNDICLLQAHFTHIEFCGFMGMATNTENEKAIRKEFKYLKELFNETKSKYFYDNTSFKEISMGMSSDYQIAIEEGSTMVRMGSSIFGDR